jgi:hypothetical protein
MWSPAAADSILRMWSQSASTDHPIWWAHVSALLTKPGVAPLIQECHPLLLHYVDSVGESGLYDRASAIAEGLLVGVMPETEEGWDRFARFRIAYMYWTGMAGKHPRAKRLATQLIVDLNDRFGPDHLHTLRSRMYEIRWESESEPTETSITRYEALVEDMCNALHADHMATLIVRNNLANSYGHLGRFDEAAAYGDAVRQLEVASTEFAYVLGRTTDTRSIRD